MTADLPAVLGGAAAFPERLPLVRPYVPDQDAVVRELADVVASGLLTNGRKVRELEELVAARCRVRHAVAVSSCTAGLMLVYRILGASGRVVLPSMTFAASAHAVAWAGGRPVWADVETAGGTLDPASVERVLDGALAVSATHVYGAPCDVPALQRLADRAGVPLVLDAAHALGAELDGRPVGGFGAAEVFSLSPTKVAVAGEGGIVTTDDDALAAALRIGRDYGNPGDYDCRFVGLNARMSELHAVLGVASVRRLDEIGQRRRELVESFRSAAAGLPGVRLAHVREGATSVWKDLTVVVEPAHLGLGPAELSGALRAEGVDTRRYFDPPCHRQQAYAGTPPEQDLPGTDWWTARVLTLPLHTSMTPAVLQRLADAVARLHDHAEAVRAALADAAADAA